MNHRGLSSFFRRRRSAGSMSFLTTKSTKDLRNPFAAFVVKERCLMAENSYGVFFRAT
jgi:hypothetical protein